MSKICILFIFTLLAVFSACEVVEASFSRIITQDAPPIKPTALKVDSKDAQVAPQFKAEILVVKAPQKVTLQIDRNVVQDFLRRNGVTFVQGRNYDIQEAVRCTIAGNKYRQQGLFGRFRCVKEFSDGKKPCKSSSDCQGQCIVTSSTNEGGARCKQNDSPFGCYVTIEQYQVAPFIICRD